LIRRTLLVLCVAAALDGCGASGALDRLAAGESGRVVDVRAGDALTLDSGLVVRLAGVEAPHGPAPGAQAATDALTRLTLGQTVTLFYGGARRDRYGRAIAQLRVARHGVWVQDALLKGGEVRVHTWPDNTALARDMLAAEAGARIANKGLWAMPAYRVLLPPEATTTTGFAVVEGRVAQVSAKPGPVWLDFAEGGTAILAPAQALPAFRAAGVNFQTLRGHLVRVRGWVSGGVLTLDHPAALERLSS
jgi:micrococcal nuclease